MSERLALSANRIFDGELWHEDALLVLDGGVIEAVIDRTAADGIDIVETGAELLAPGFVDIQANGGGGAMFNDQPTSEGIAVICRAHARFGTTALLPTLITDTPDVTAAAISAGIDAAHKAVPGFAGLHLEGPHISIARKGAHDPALIRSMTEDDLAALVAARKGLPALVCTIAPESVSLRQVAALAAAGTAVSLGHTDTDFATARAYADAGATLTTHLFNAMSQIANREPGLVGATLEDGRLSAGLIADGVHVDPANVAIALRAKRGPGSLLLVTDAMSVLGTDLQSFTLNGRTIHRREGRLTLSDGTLAGADLDMISAIRFMHHRMGVELGEALRMASLYPAQAIGLSGRVGRFRRGMRADVVALSHELDVTSVWMRGQRMAS